MGLTLIASCATAPPPLVPPDNPTQKPLAQATQIACAAESDLRARPEGPPMPPPARAGRDGMELDQLAAWSDGLLDWGERLQARVTAWIAAEPVLARCNAGGGLPPAEVAAFPFVRVLRDLDASVAAIDTPAPAFDERADLGRLSNPNRAAWEFQALTEMCAAQPELAEIFCKAASE